MDELGIIRICDALHLDYGRVRVDPISGTQNLSISCPLAIVRHGDPHDGNKSCSIKVVDDGPSRVRCFSGNCRFHGSLIRLVRDAVVARGSPQYLTPLLTTVTAVETVTLQGKVSRGQQKLQGHHAWKPPVRDRELLSEKIFEPFANSIPQYAIDRGITVETAKAWGLGYDKAGGYLVFPVRRLDDGLVGLVGRAVRADSKRPHHNYSGLDKSKYLFGAHMLEAGKPVVIVESCIDTLNTWQALEGSASVVASLGEGFSSAHALTISTARPPFVAIFTDGDSAGRLMANKIAYTLHQKKLLTKIMECPWGPIIDATADGRSVRRKVDPSNLPFQMVKEVFDDAVVVRGGKIQWTNPPPIFVTHRAT